MARTKTTQKTANVESTALDEVNETAKEARTKSESKKKQNIYEKLSDIGETVKLLAKDTDGYNFTYVAEADILIRIRGMMREKNVSLIPKVVPGTFRWTPRDTVQHKVDRAGNPANKESFEVIVDGDMEFDWVNNDNPEERIEVPWHFIGQQEDASQAYGSALTYASRYFLLRYFNVPTANDPDELLAKKKRAEEQEEQAVLKDIISNITKVISEAVAKDEKNKIRIAKMVEDKIGTKDYTKLKRSTEAAALLEYLNKEVNA